MRWLFLCLLGGLFASEAARARTVDLSYEIYFGGFSVAEFQSRIEYGAGDYRVRTEARSTGMLDFFFPIEVTSEGTGGIGDGRIEPYLFRSNGTFDGEERSTSLRARAGTFPEVVIDPPRDPEKRDAVPEHLQRDTVDPYAALISLALSGREAPCAGDLRVFNGRTRTDFKLTPAGSESLARTDYNIYEGPAERCEIHYETLAGGYKKPWFGRDKSGLKTWVWLARIDDRGPWIPVRLESEGTFGNVVGHITRLAVGPALVRKAMSRP